MILHVPHSSTDTLEVMVKKGMDVCHTTNSFAKPLRDITDKEKEEIIENHYRPNHLKFTQQVHMGHNHGY